MDYDELKDRYNNAVESTKESIDRYDDELDKVVKNTALAILYIQNERIMLKELIKKKGYYFGAFIRHLNHMFGEVDVDTIRPIARKELGLYDYELMVIFVFKIIIVLMFAWFVFLMVTS